MTVLYFVLIYLAQAGLTAAGISYAPTGKWQEAGDPDLCGKQYLCAPGNLTWVSEGSPTLFNVSNVCDSLVSAGVTSIDFHGDSYMRQIYAAILITLNGNYKNGSIADTQFALQNGASKCNYHTQFAEKHCGVRSLNHGPRVCDGRVQLDPLLIGVDNLDKCRKAGNGSIVLFSWGNYPVAQGYRAGVNNPNAYAKFFEESGLCPNIRRRDEGRKRGNGSVQRKLRNRSMRSPCDFYWVSTHYRLIAHFPDEKEEKVKAYNEKMRDFWESGACGDVSYVDVYNMTAALGKNHHSVATSLSYDQVHWGMEVNLLKAQIILNALVSG
jgi:hypothetical protein